MIINSTASSNNVDDGQADEPANIPEATDSDKELEKEWQEQSELGKPRSNKARAKPQAETHADWQTKHDRGQFDLVRALRMWGNKAKRRIQNE